MFNDIAIDDCVHRRWSWSVFWATNEEAILFFPDYTIEVPGVVTFHRELWALLALIRWVAR